MQNISFPAHFDAHVVCASIDGNLASFFHNNLTPTFHSVMQIVSGPGSAIALGLALPLLLVFLAVRKRWVSFLAVLLTAPGMLFTELLKVLVQRQRPFPGVETGYSFPSGHTTGVTLLYGMILVLIWPHLKTAQHRFAAGLITLTLIVLVAFSRIALTAHYFSDVLAALCVSTMWLTIVTMFTRRMRRRATVSVSE